LQHCLHVHQLGRLDAAIGLDRLRAIAAIFRAAAGLDRQQRAQLDLAGAMVRAMHLGGAEYQFGERQVEQRRDLLARPVGDAALGRANPWRG
jgi:hypothetical protein